MQKLHKKLQSNEAILSTERESFLTCRAIHEGAETSSFLAILKLSFIPVTSHNEKVMP